MNSTVDMAALLAPATARFDRQRTEARQQRWMAELEQAMFAPQAPRSLEGTAAPAAQAHGEAAPAAARGAAAQPVPRPGSAASGAPSTAASGAAAANGAAAQGLRNRPDGAPMGHHGEEGPRAADDAQAAEAEVEAGAGAVIPSLAAAGSGRGGAAPGIAGAAGAPVTAAVLAGEPAQAPVVQPFAPLLPGAFGAALEAADMPASDGAAAGPGQDAAPGDEYAKQLLHLFHGDDGVQAYIRDAELSGAQMRAVAQALAVELGMGGQRLAGLTVNGRRVVVPDTAHEEEQPVTAHDAALPRIIEKGNI